MGVLRSTRQSGQILLIVVLAAVISLTVGLSVASRVITNTKTTADQVNAQKALSAAETGVEQSLKSGSSIAVPTTFPGSGSNFKTTATTINQTQFLVNGGNLVAQDDGADIWLSGHGPANGKPQYSNPAPQNMTIRVYWKDNTCPNTPAIELIVLSGVVATPTLNRYVYDPCGRISGTLDTTNDLTSSPKDIKGVKFRYYAQRDITNAILARVIPLYNSATVGVELYKYQDIPNTLANPPAQGTLIESTGSSGNVTRTLRVFQGYPKLPTELFPYTLFIP